MNTGDIAYKVDSFMGTQNNNFTALSIMANNNFMVTQIIILYNILKRSRKKLLWFPSQVSWEGVE